MTVRSNPDEAKDQSFPLRSATVLQIQTFRVICQPQDMEEDFVQWNISPVEVQMAPGETAPIYALVGDLAVGVGEWFVGATASIVFAASDDEADETAMREELSAVAQHYGPWAARVLWDHVSAAARTVSALCHGSAGRIDIPGDMPDVAYPSSAGQTGPTMGDE
ncbi:hypothetical protein [Actinomyces viscosus]|uniref:hypothetical protein n=1 Tax=Actinomyces viscosus TaxID=1656 RepID=UPI0028E7D360|nr:hypothetical protein [Actinomyces viscosus]